MNAMTAVMRDPTIRAHGIALSVTGLLVYIVLIIAGIGLIQLSSWGRTLALWLAGLEIARMAIFAAVFVVVIQPITTAQTEKMLAKLEATAKASGGAPGAGASVQVAKMMAGMGSVFAIGRSIFAGAKAACQAKKSKGQDEY